MDFTTIASFLFFTALVGVLTWWITRKDETSSTTGYFLAGRSLTFPLIAGSLLLTNLSTEQLVGLNGNAFSDGFCLMVWEVVSVISMVAMAWFFLPRFLKSGVATVPEYLSLRFDKQTELITNVIFLLAYVGILLPMILGGFIGDRDMAQGEHALNFFYMMREEGGPVAMVLGLVGLLANLPRLGAAWGQARAVRSSGPGEAVAG